ncbi:helix-turn-helix transcriptional regulator [Nocardia mikamii]|uniref:helix-turn-helix transcriptional regulator n=1 Tax=Nocardia mikamii TaxID=508464 RepID=UPI001FE02E51|nr:helix-turn-helix transcriptional regulator [Nocardia mikamii]
MTRPRGQQAECALLLFLMTNDAHRRREQLREFLRGRRERLTPAEVGLAPGGRRRTPGLRREEVAQLAGVGVSWYTWLEQGRDITVSADVLDAVARALRLTEWELAHLYVLAGLNPPRAVADRDARVTEELRHLLTVWSPRPAVLRDRYWNILAVNAGARTAFGYDCHDYNCLVSFFTNASYRQMHPHWIAAAPAVVAAYRADAAQGDPEFDRVITELCTVSTEFAELWARHDVGAPTQAVHAVRHPDAGDLYFDTTTLIVADHPDLHLVLYNPRPGTETEQRLGLLTPERSAAPA